VALQLGKYWWDGLGVMPEDEKAEKRFRYHMSNIFWKAQPTSVPPGGHVDSKLMQRIREKKIAHGHKPDDHEEQQQGGWNMTM